jgi:hypothetical protein
MELNDKEKTVLRTIVGRELQKMKEDFEKLKISNSPFLNKVSNDNSDLQFMKNEQDYELFLKGLLEKLK